MCFFRGEAFSIPCHFGPCYAERVREEQIGVQHRLPIAIESAWKLLARNRDPCAAVVILDQESLVAAASSRCDTVATSVRVSNGIPEVFALGLEPQGRLAGA